MLGGETDESRNRVRLRARYLEHYLEDSCDGDRDQKSRTGAASVAARRRGYKRALAVRLESVVEGGKKERKIRNIHELSGT